MTREPDWQKLRRDGVVVPFGDDKPNNSAVTCKIDPIALRVVAESMGIVPTRGNVNRDDLWQGVVEAYDRLTASQGSSLEHRLIVEGAARCTDAEFRNACRALTTWDEWGGR